MSGTCSFSVARFTSDTPGRDSIRLFKGLNSLSACTVVTRNPQCRSYWYTSLKALNISGTVRFARLLTAVKHIFDSTSGRMGFYSQKRCHMWGRLPCATLSILQGSSIDPWPLHSDFSEWYWLSVLQCSWTIPSTKLQHPGISLDSSWYGWCESPTCIPYLKDS